MSYEKKIEKELAKHDRQWEDAVCPDVVKFGKQADRKIKELTETIIQLTSLVELMRG